MKRHQIVVRMIGGVFGLLTLWMLYLSLSNAWTYLRLREFPAEVVSSSLVIDTAHVEGHIEPFYVLRLQLRSLDGANRVLAWEHELENASYPEEAYDELARWAPGTRHQVLSVRGDARDLRFAAERIPERERIFGFLLAAAFFFIFCGLLLFGPALDRLGWHRKGDAGGLVFGFFGMLPLLGAVAFAWTEIPKIALWPLVSASLVKDPVAVPPTARMTESAQVLFQQTAGLEVFRFTYNGRELHFGTGGRWGGAYRDAETVCRPLGRCTFRIHPTDRWRIAARADLLQEFLITMGALLFFGGAFSAAGWFIWSKKF